MTDRCAPASREGSGRGAVRNMSFKLLTLITGLAVLPAMAQQPAGSSVPLAPAWNIASSGEAASSGELLFRVTPGNDADPVEVTVFVLSGANETGVASSIRRAMNSQLDPSRFNVSAGEGANVLVTDARATSRGNAGFAMELVDSDIENVRVQVSAATPVAPPTVPSQSVPANPPPPATPPEPGNAAPPAEPPAAPPGTVPATPAAPPAQSSSPPAEPSAPVPGEPSSANGGAGAPASTPPPPPGTS
jgi:hypothetical protein